MKIMGRTPDFLLLGVWPGRKHHEKADGPSPRIPVELTGFRELHAPFLRERRTRGLVQRCVAGIRGPLRSLQRVGYATVSIEIRGFPPFAKNAEDPDFLLRGTNDVCVCGFLEGKPHEVR
jgi:hypothetical protein